MPLGKYIYSGVYIDMCMEEIQPPIELSPTPADRAILKLFLGGNEPLYPAEIARQVKLSKEQVGKRCKALDRMGILDIKMKKPRRYGFETKSYLLKLENDAFKKVAHIILTSQDEYDKFVFIRSKYAQDHINENLVRQILFDHEICQVKRICLSTDLSTLEKNEYKNAVDSSGKFLFVYPGIHKKDLELLKKKNPRKEMIFPQPIDLKLPIFPQSLSEPEMAQRFFELNRRIRIDYNSELDKETDPIKKENIRKKSEWIKEYCDALDEGIKRLFHFSFVERHYKLGDETSEVTKDKILRILSLIQISPNALYKVLFQFERFREVPNKVPAPQHEWEGSFGYPLRRVSYMMGDDFFAHVSFELVFSAIFDLSRSYRIPADSIVREAFVYGPNDDPPNDRHLLTLDLKDGRRIKFDEGFSLISYGFSSFVADGGITVPKEQVHSHSSFSAVEPSRQGEPAPQEGED
jgi:DNA-binding Lrp family transcriptional regulator